MNNLYSNIIYNGIRERIFGKMEAFNVDIHPDILKIVKVVDNITLDGKMFTIKIQDINVYIIRELNGFVYMNTLLIDNARGIVCSIPYDLYNYDQKAMIRITKDLYKYICSQLMNRQGNTLYNNIATLAPVVLTLHTLVHLCDDVYIKDYIDNDDINMILTEEILHDSLSYSVEELLDYGGIIAICEEKIKGKQDTDE